jgi:ankyrin repeat protein
MAASGNSLDVTRLLIDSGADINAKEGMSNTALHIAVTANDIDFVRLLIDSGADIEAKAYLDWTPLLQAVSQQYLDIAWLLIENGANADSIDLSCLKQGSQYAGPLPDCIAGKDVSTVEEGS